MLHANFMLFYVDRPEASGAFYADLLGQQPAQTSPNFVMFVLPSGLNLGLWSRHVAEPSATAAGGGGELAFTAESAAIVDETYAAWTARGIKILQEPVKMDFGYTFVALDLDGHRLRVFAPAR